jgi:hypothetical protein
VHFKGLDAISSCHIVTDEMSLLAKFKELITKEYVFDSTGIDYYIHYSENQKFVNILSQNIDEFIK